MGTLLAGIAGRFNPLYYALTLGGMIAFHAATNVLNDFYDVKHGVDREGAPTTKYRLHPAAFGQVPLSTTLAFSVGLYAVTLAAGLYLAMASSTSILFVIAAGILGSVFYTADPVDLKARSLGEPTVFIMWGLLIPLGAYMVQTGTFSWAPLLASVPIGIFVALVLLANNIRDVSYDGTVRERTLAVSLGSRRAQQLYLTLLALAYALVATGILAEQLPVWSVAVFFTVPGALGLAKMFRGRVPDDADPRTAALAFQFSLLYMVSLVLYILIPLKLPF
jgi:1,4-dihydroxy-2-naphthoate octaprenyltransferase